MLHKILLTVLGIICLNFTANSQSKTMVGIKLDAFSALHESFKTAPAVSLTLNRHYGAHHGLETGLTYYKESYQLDLISLSYPRINRHYLALPLSYKYYSSKLCFSAGMILSQYIGWDYGGTDAKLTGYSSAEYDTSVGLLLSVSKQIKLSDQDLLEPTIFFQPMVDIDMKWFAGIGIAYKFKVGKKE